MHNTAEFISSVSNPERTCMMVFAKDEIVVRDDNGILEIPSLQEIKKWNIEVKDVRYIAPLNGDDYYGADLRSTGSLGGGCLKKLMQLPGKMPAPSLRLIFRAFHILHWVKTNKFCGCCGKVMQEGRGSQEFSLGCPDCGHTVYPRISPAVIVAVVKGDKILLARPNSFPVQHYSVISGFINPGESLEACVKREVQEEAGIEVDQVEYFGSQPWPFPDVLMIAFTARYVSGEIVANDKELYAAGWFSAADLPESPPEGGIARRLIDWFVQKHSQQSIH